MPDSYKTISLAPLTGIFDARSSVDAEPSGAFAWKQNFEISTDGKLRHAHGFAKPYVNLLNPSCAYANWDWHDQGVAVADREPPTLYFPATTNDRKRFLLKGTKTRLLKLNETTGVWTPFSSSGLGNDGDANLTQLRFHAAELQNKVVFTNGFDDVQYYDLLSPFTFGSIGGLAGASETGGAVTKAKVVLQWQGVILLMNTVEDGGRIASRIRWSDLNNALDWGAGASSISDYQDLDYGEEILNAVPLGGSLYVFTQQSIWRCNFTIDNGNATSIPIIPPSAVLNCIKIYTDPKNQSKCLAYPNSMASTGFAVYYASRDAIYEFDPYKLEPELVEWIHRADILIFDDPAKSPTAIDKTCCNSPIAEYHPDTKEIHFSWPSPDVVQVASDNCEAAPPIQGSGINNHTLVINTAFTTCDYRDYGSTAMVNFKSDIGVTGSCNQSILFLGACGTDFCLKEFGVGYAREIYDPVAGTFSMTAYLPILRGVFPFGTFDMDKKIKSVRIDCIPENKLLAIPAWDNGSAFRLRAGTSYKTVNPNSTDASCGVLWKQFSDKVIKCPDKATLTSCATNKIRPTDDFKWSFLLRGRFLYFEITIVSPGLAGAKTTAGVSLSRIDVKAIQV